MCDMMRVTCDVLADFACVCRRPRRRFHALCPSKGTGGAAQRLVRNQPNVARHSSYDVLCRFVCSLDDRDGRLGVWAGAKVRHVTWWRVLCNVFFRLDLLALAWAGRDILLLAVPHTTPHILPSVATPARFSTLLYLHIYTFNYVMSFIFQCFY
jgi:hypothetical protein